MNFQQDVLEKSKHQPVVVDFWAPWCAPCLVLGPVIETIAEEQQGQWSLVKLNTEEEPQIASQYGIRSIPNVKMFLNGNVIAEFAGALPKHMILEWLNENLPNEEKKEWNTLLETIKETEETESVSVLESFLIKHPDFEEAQTLLARKVVFQNPEKATQLVEKIKMGHPGFDFANDIRSFHEFSNVQANESAVTNHLATGYAALKAGEMEKGIESIIEAVSLDKSFQNDLPRRTAIAVFHLLGDHHELTKKYRRLFDMALY